MQEIFEKIKKYGIRKSIRFGRIEFRGKIYKIFSGSFSQSQEDLAIKKFLKNKNQGVYIDIGAGDGIRYSNTYYYYLNGWRGINIEPDPDNFKKLIKNRPEDINIQVAAAEKNGFRVLHRFLPPMNSTMSANVRSEFLREGYQEIGKTKVRIKTLQSICERYYKNRKIDFITIDTEGYDFMVLKGINWKKLKPGVICIENEMKHHNEGKAKIGDIHSFLLSQNYNLVWDNGINRIYKSL